MNGSMTEGKPCVQPPHRVAFDPTFFADLLRGSQREPEAVLPLPSKKLVPKQMKE